LTNHCGGLIINYKPLGAAKPDGEVMNVDFTQEEVNFLQGLIGNVLPNMQVSLKDSAAVINLSNQIMKKLEATLLAEAEDPKTRPNPKPKKVKE
jgi:hypothetical protein